MPKRLRGEFENLHFTHSFGRPTITFCVKGRSDKLKICILPQFWASDDHFLGSLSPVGNLHFTTVLDVRHARSDERVAKLRNKFAFTTVLSVRSARSDERVLKSKGAPPAPWREKKIDFNRDINRE